MREIAVRTVLRVIDGIALYMVGLIVMLVTGERRQRIGDLAASTIVVDASAPADVRLQARSESLCQHDGRPIFQLEPDILVSAHGRRWVLDTKWKLLDASCTCGISEQAGSRRGLGGSCVHAQPSRSKAYAVRSLRRMTPP